MIGWLYNQIEFHFFDIALNFYQRLDYHGTQFEERPCKEDQLSYVSVVFSDNRNGTVTKSDNLRQSEGIQELGHL